MIIISQEMGQPYFGVLHLGQSFYPFVKGLPKGLSKGLLCVRATSPDWYINNDS